MSKPTGCLWNRCRRRRRRFISVLSLATLALIVGCDPGITIRQVNSARRPARGAAAPAPHVILEVKNYHRLAGELFYEPTVQIVNLSDSPIAITGCELVSKHGSYPNTPRQADMYPLGITARGTATLTVGFDTPHGLDTTFKRVAELRVHYRIADSDEVASASLVGKIEAGESPSAARAR